MDPHKRDLAANHGFRRQKGRRPGSHGPRLPGERLDGTILARQCLSATALREGWGRVWRNHGASGGDGMTCTGFARNAHARLGDLRRDLSDGSYRPGALREVDIPKKGGGTRLLRIPCVRDRIVQTAVAQALSAQFENEFEPASFGYRPGRSVAMAVRSVEYARSEGFTHVVDADIERFFDRVDHDRLMSRFAESVTDGPVTDLIWLWLTHWAPQGRGLAQGSPVSPLLANLYLDRLDEALWLSGLRIIRYADDFVVLAKGTESAEAVMALTQQLLAREGLTLNSDKSRVMSFERGFRYLGHLFMRSMTLKVTENDGLAPDDLGALMARLGDDDERAETEQALIEAETSRLERGGYRHAAGMRVLHVIEPGRRLRARRDALVVEEPLPAPRDSDVRTVEWRPLLALPHGRVDRVDLGPANEIDRSTADYLVGNDIPLALVDRDGATAGWLSPAAMPYAGRHLKQAELSLDHKRRLDLARRFVVGRMRAQRTSLRRLLAERDDTPARVTVALTQLNKTLPRGQRALDDAEQAKGPLMAATSIETIRGHEGAVTAKYWPALGALCGDPMFVLTKRQRPAGDSAANIILNVLAHLLERDISVAVQRAGLHPGFGVLHGTRDHHSGCVFDLMEEFRAPLAEGLFVYLVNRRIVRSEHFEVTPDAGGGSARLRPDGYRAIVKAYESRIAQTVAYGYTGKRVRWRELMMQQALRLAAHCEGRDVYVPYDMDQDRREAAQRKNAQR